MPVQIEIRAGDSVAIDNGRITVTLEEKSGQRARLRFDAPADVNIERVMKQASSINNVRAMGLGKKS